MKTTHPGTHRPSCFCFPSAGISLVKEGGSREDFLEAMGMNCKQRDRRVGAGDMAQRVNAPGARAENPHGSSQPAPTAVPSDLMASLAGPVPMWSTEHT